MITLNGLSLSPGCESGMTCDTDDSEQIEIKTIGRSSVKKFMKEITLNCISQEQNFSPSDHKKKKLNNRHFQEIIIDAMSKQRINKEFRSMLIDIEEEYTHN